MTASFTIQSSALPSSAILAAFHAREGFSTLFEVDLVLVLDGAAGHDFDLAAALGEQATLEVGHGTAATVLAHGVFASMALVGAMGQRYVYRALVVPRLWHLARSVHSRVFTGQSVPEVLAGVLAGNGFTPKDYRFELARSYGARDLVVQYKESDFAFLSRWMEREGLHYHFEHDADRDVLVVRDDSARSQPSRATPLRYFPQAPGVFSADSFRAFTATATAQPAKVMLRDYDYEHPTLDVAGAAEVAPGGVGAVREHGLGFVTPEEGARLATVKAEALRAERVRFRGSTATPGLRAGTTFTVDEHPRADFNVDYLTTAVEQWGNQVSGVPEAAELVPWDDSYRAEVTAIVASVTYRAAQRTPWPRIHGTERATVDGPGTSDYAQLDADGRYALKFQFDESSLAKGKASSRVRMLQPHGGSPESFHFPLRAGTEVVCVFEGGDPDRPAIAGVAPNALNPSPVTSANSTMNIIHTGGGNKIEIEDKDGSQQILISTPHKGSYLKLGAPTNDKHLIDHTEGNKLSNVLGNRMTFTEGAATSWTGGFSMGTVVGLATSLTIGGRVSFAIPFVLDATVGWRRSYMVGPAYARFIGPRTTVIKGFDKTTVTGPRSTTVTGDTFSMVTGTVTSIVVGATKSRIEGSRDTAQVGNSKTVVFGDNTTEVVGNNKNKIVGNASGEITGLYRTQLNDRIEVIDGFKLERIKGPAYKFSDKEVQVVEGKASFKSAKLETAAAVVDTKATLNLQSADLTIFK